MPINGIMPNQPPPPGGGDRLRRVGQRRRGGRDGEDPADSVTRAADHAELTSTPDVLNGEAHRPPLQHDDANGAHEERPSKPGHPGGLRRGDRDGARSAGRLNLKG